MSTPILMSWSGGKDSTWALRSLLNHKDYEVRGLLTSINFAYQRVAIHGFRVELLEAQAQRLGLPLWTVPLPSPCTNADYEAALGGVLVAAKQQGICGVAFGDLFLEDIRAYREEQLARFGLTPIFPIWGLDTQRLALEMIAWGLRARVTCVDLRKLDARFAGREFDRGYLNELPAGIDHCGENGEFHTLTYDAPIFARRLPLTSGLTVEREGNAFADLLLLKDAEPAVSNFFTLQ